MFVFDDLTLDAVVGESAVATALVYEVALLGRRTYTAAVAAEGSTTALGLTLVILEDEQVVISRLELGAGEGLIRRRGAPAGRVASLQADSIKGAHRLVGVARAAAIRQCIRGEALLHPHVLEGGLDGGLEIHVLEVIATNISLDILESLQVRHAERAHIHH